jgi:hypothetical protein
MTLKKSLENRLRGWLPKEPTVSKNPREMRFQSRIKTDNRKQNSPGFKLRRWISGVSAFTLSLWRQMGLLTQVFTISMIFLLGGFVLGINSIISSNQYNVVLFGVVAVNVLFRLRQILNNNLVLKKRHYSVIYSLLVGIILLTALSFVYFASSWLVLYIVGMLAIVSVDLVDWHTKKVTNRQKMEMKL